MASSTINSPACAVGTVLAPQASCYIDLGYENVTQGLNSETVSVTGSNGQVLPIETSVTGVSSLPVTAYYGNSEYVGSSPKGVLLANGAPILMVSTSTQTYTVVAINFSANSPLVLDPNSSCSVGSTITDSGCTVGFDYTPTQLGSQSDSPVLEYRDGSGTIHSYTLQASGTGAPPPSALTLSPSALSFASLSAGTPLTGCPVSAQLTNTGSTTLTAQYQITGPSSQAYFFDEGTTCLTSGQGSLGSPMSQLVDASLAPQQSCTICVAAYPTLTGTQSATLAISASDSESLSAPITANVGPVEPAGLQVSVNRGSPYQVVAGDISPVFTVTLTNPSTSQGALYIGSVSMTGTSTSGGVSAQIVKQPSGENGASPFVGRLMSCSSEWSTFSQCTDSTAPPTQCGLGVPGRTLAAEVLEPGQSCTDTYTYVNGEADHSYTDAAINANTDTYQLTYTGTDASGANVVSKTVTLSAKPYLYPLGSSLVLAPYSFTTTPGASVTENTTLTNQGAGPVYIMYQAGGPNDEIFMPSYGNGGHYPFNYYGSPTNSPIEAGYDCASGVTDVSTCPSVTTPAPAFSVLGISGPNCENPMWPGDVCNVTILFDGSKTTSGAISIPVLGDKGYGLATATMTGTVQ
jgi:hypothetical protein